MAISEVTTVITDLTALFDEIYGFLYSAMNVAELGILGVALIGGIMSLIVSAVISLLASLAGLAVSLVFYLLETLPIFILARKAKRRKAILAWIPILSSYFRLYVLTDIVGTKPFALFGGHIRMRSRFYAFFTYLGILFFGNALISLIIAVLNMIPALGQVIGLVSILLYLLPHVASAMFEYVFLRDVLDLFNENTKANQIGAIVVTVLDNTVTFGLARLVCLYGILGKKPLYIPVNRKD